MESTIDYKKKWSCGCWNCYTSVIIYLNYVWKKEQYNVLSDIIHLPGFGINSMDILYLNRSHREHPTAGRPQEQTLLMAAIKEKNIELVKLLLQHPKINPNKGDKNSTPLLYAVARGLTDIVQLLVDTPGIDVNKIDKYVRMAEISSGNQDPYTPLCLAVDRAHTDIVKILLSSPTIDVNKTTMQRRSPLFCACTPLAYSTNNPMTLEDGETKHKRSLECARLLLDDSRTQKDFVYTICNEFVRALNYLINSKELLAGTRIPSDVFLYHHTPGVYITPWKIKRYVSLTALKAIERMTDFINLFGVKESYLPRRHPAQDLNILFDDFMDRNYGLTNSIGYILFEDLLYKLDTSPNYGERVDKYSGWYEVYNTLHAPPPLLEATEERLEQLLAHPEIDVNARDPESGKCALMSAVDAGDMHRVHRLLLVPGIDVNHFSRGESILRAAVCTRNVEIVKQILAHPTLNSSLLCNALLAAVVLQAEDIVSAFLERFESTKKIRHPSNRIYKLCKNRALLYACQYDKLEIVKMLVLSGCNINYVGTVRKQPTEHHNGIGLRRTPLIAAAGEGHLEIVKFLLKQKEIKIYKTDQLDLLSTYKHFNDGKFIKSAFCYDFVTLWRGLIEADQIDELEKYNECNRKEAESRVCVHRTMITEARDAIKAAIIIDNVDIVKEFLKLKHTTAYLRELLYWANNICPSPPPYNTVAYIQSILELRALTEIDIFGHFNNGQKVHPLPMDVYMYVIAPMLKYKPRAESVQAPPVAHEEEVPPVGEEDEAPPVVVEEDDDDEEEEVIPVPPPVVVEEDDDDEEEEVIPVPPPRRREGVVQEVIPVPRRRVNHLITEYFVPLTPLGRRRGVMIWYIPKSWWQDADTMDEYPPLPMRTRCRRITEYFSRQN